MKWYLSHSIRGKYGNAATNVQIKENCDAAIAIGEQIRRAIPSIELYIPGGQTEIFVQIAYQRKYLTEKQILDVDCGIIDNCEGAIFYVPEGDELQGGRLIEYNHAVKNNKPICVFSKVESVIGWLSDYILKV